MKLLPNLIKIPFNEKEYDVPLWFLIGLSGFSFIVGIFTGYIWYLFLYG